MKIKHAQPLSLITAFMMGFITLSIEIMGFRVLAPYFGYSIYVFGSLIGLILSAFAIGYWFGGLASSRAVKPTSFFAIVLAAALYLALMSALYTFVLEAFRSYSLIPGTLAATLLLWGFPMVAFAGVSPYLVGMRALTEHPGRAAGWISTAGTVGGLAGTFATSFFLLPVLGTRTVFTWNAYAAVMVSLLWLLLNGRRRWFLALMVAPLLANSFAPSRLPAEVVHAEESAYSRLEVIDLGSALGLRTEMRSGSIYSAATKDGSLPPFLLYDLFAVPVTAVHAQHGLLLGLGAGTLPRVHSILNPDLKIHGVEIDPRVVEIGKEFFGLGGLKNVSAITIADARPFVANTNERFDVIEMDVFRESEIPFYLVSKEFFEITRARLERDGVFAMNVFDASRDRKIERRVANTLASVYPDTYEVPAELGSFLLVGANDPLKLPAEVGDPSLSGLIKYFESAAKKVTPDSNTNVFTDNLAPIEALYGSNR